MNRAKPRTNTREARGDHLCRCSRCNDAYIGDKRSFVCADCAYSVVPSTHDPVARIREILAECTPDQRVDLLRAVTFGYCRECGGVGTPCACQRDE